MTLTAIIKIITYRIWVLTFSLLILLAIYVSLGRQFVPLIGEHKAQIENMLNEVSSKMGLNIRLQKISGEWQQFSPAIAIKGLQVSSDMANTNTYLKEGNYLYINEVLLELDVIASIQQLRWIVKEISIDGIDVILNETENGQWQLEGLDIKKNSTGKNTSLRRIGDLLLDGHYIQINNTNLLVRRFSGERFFLNNGHFEIKNFADVHQLNISAKFPEQEQPLSLLIDAIGDPRDHPNEFIADAYLHIPDSKWSGLLEGVTIADLQLKQLSGGSEIWGRWENNRLADLRGNIAVNNLQLARRESKNTKKISNNNQTNDWHNIEPIKNWSTSFFFNEFENNQWRLQLDNFTLQWKDLTWKNTQWQAASQITQDGRLFSMLTGYVSAPIVNGLLVESKILIRSGKRRELHNILETLNPQGDIHNASFLLPLSGKQKNHYRVTGNIYNAEVSAWMQAPAGKGVNGYIEFYRDAQYQGGMVDFHSQNFVIDFPELYKNSIGFAHVKGQVRWFYDDRHAVVQSNIMDLKNKDGDFKAYFELDLARKEHYTKTKNKELADSTMSLIIGVNNGDVASKDIYIPNKVKKDIRDWITPAVVSGDIKKGGFIYHGSIMEDAKEQGNQAEIQSYFDVNNTVLDYQPGKWPRLKDLQGFVVVDGDAVNAEIKGGRILNSTLYRAQVNVWSDKKYGPVLSLKGDLLSNLQDDQYILTRTPLKEVTGDFLPNWKMQGDTLIDLDIRVPITKKSHTQLLQGSDIVVSVKNGSLYIPEQDLSFSQLYGELGFSNKKFLYTDQLTARLFDNDVNISIQSDKNTTEEKTSRKKLEENNINRVVNVRLKGDVGVSQLQQWEIVKGSELLTPLDGLLDYEADVNINTENKQYQVNIHSLLTEVDVDLPLPFAKEKGIKRPVWLSMNFAVDRRKVKLQYADLMDSYWLLDNSDVESGIVHFGDILEESLNEKLPESGIDITGELPFFNWENWSSFNTARVGSTTLLESDWSKKINKINISVHELNFYGQLLDDMRLDIINYHDYWQLNISNPVIKGQIDAFAGMDSPSVESKPLNIKLDYLHLPEQDKSEDENYSAMNSVEPNKLPALDVTIADIKVGDEDYGEWSFQLNATENGAALSNIIGNIRGLTVSGASGGSGANLLWQYQQGEHQSFFEGKLAGKDFSDILRAWGISPILESKESKFLGAFSWHGPPTELNAKSLEGQVSFEIRRGRYISALDKSALAEAEEKGCYQTRDNTGNSSFGGAFTKMLGFFNLSGRLSRQAKLDFSDVYRDGIAYEFIRGTLDFDDYQVKIRDNVEVEAPFSDLTITGHYDFAQEQIDLDMTAVLPVDENLPLWTAVLTSANPAAIGGAYLAGKILEDITTARYTIMGNISCPQMRLDKVTSKKKEKKAEPEIDNTESVDMEQESNSKSENQPAN